MSVHVSLNHHEGPHYAPARKIHLRHDLMRCEMRGKVRVTRPKGALEGPHASMGFGRERSERICQQQTAPSVSYHHLSDHHSLRTKHVSSCHDVCVANEGCGLIDDMQQQRRRYKRLTLNVPDIRSECDIG